MFNVHCISCLFGHHVFTPYVGHACMDTVVQKEIAFDKIQTEWTILNIY